MIIPKPVLNLFGLEKEQPLFLGYFGQFEY